MAKLTDLDIPAGLEELYARVVALNPQGDMLKGTLKVPQQNLSHAQKTKLRSLFVQWEPIWDTFLQPRRDAWQAYWATLPFGAHSGAQGWPGSGYSAFVYWNTPRWRAGLPLDLDPPYGPNLLTNGTFTGSASPWVLYRYVTWQPEHVTFVNVGDFYNGSILRQLFDGLPGGSETTATLDFDYNGNGRFVWFVGGTFSPIYALGPGVGHFHAQRTGIIWTPITQLDMRGYTIPTGGQFYGTIDNVALVKGLH